MQEKIYDVEMMYIQNTSGSSYSVELTGRRIKNVKLNFSNVEGVELNPQSALEISHSYMQMAEGQNKMWSLKFPFPTNIEVKYAIGKVVIEKL